jgi:hypothetical protein
VRTHGPWVYPSQTPLLGVLENPTEGFLIPRESLVGEQDELVVLLLEGRGTDVAKGLPLFVRVHTDIVRHG